VWHWQRLSELYSKAEISDMLVIDLLVRVRVLFPIAKQDALSEFVKQFALELMCSLLSDRKSVECSGG
jgi:hypothetical protein